MQRNDSVIKLFSDLVAIDSQSHKGNKEIIAYLSKLFSDYEQTRESWVRESDGVQGENLVVKIPGKNHEQSLVFVCHMDTVPTSSAWETDPFILEEKEGKLYGLGACDTKGGVAAAIEAIVQLTDAPLCDTYLVFDGDEEVSSTGAVKLLKKLPFINPHFIFIEPTDGQLHIAQRAIVKFDVITHGISTHASLGTPQRNEAENAIHKMGKVISLLANDASEIAKEQHPYLASSTQNFGLLTGGTARNVFADNAMLTIDRRLLPHRDPQEEFERLKKLITDAVPGTTVQFDDAAPAFAMEPTNLFVQQVLHAYISVDPNARIDAFHAWSEASLFAGKGDVVILGPGSISLAHKANEFVEATELFHFVHVYQKIMQEISL